MIVTDNESWAQRAKYLTTQAKDDPVEFVHNTIGYNFRLTNMQAAMGCAQFEQIDTIIASRRRMQTQYASRLEGMPGVALQKFPADVEPVVWAVSVKLDRFVFPQGRDRVIAQMQDKGIETRPGFYPPAEMPHLYGAGMALPTCEDVARQVISLPSYPSLTAEERRLEE